MDYKLLRMLLIFLQLGLIILVVLLFSLVAFSCKPGTSRKNIDPQVITINNTEHLNQRFSINTQNRRNAIQLSNFEKKLIQAQKLSNNYGQTYSLLREKINIQGKRV